MATKDKKLPIVVLISGNGSNLQAIINAQRNGLPIDIRAVISNNPNAYGLIRAKKAGIAHATISHRDFSKRLEFDATLQQCIEKYQPKLVVLAGFMRRLEHKIVEYYWGRMINIHPSLLPKHPGLETHRRVLAVKDKWHGTTIHFVTNTVDGGPIICQAKILVHANDNEISLQQRIQKIEHKMYPTALGWIAAGRIGLRDNRVLFDNKLLPANGISFQHDT